GTFDLWLFDIARGVEQPITSDRLSEFSPVWLPGGGSTIFSQQTPPRMFRKDFASGREEELLPSPLFRLPEDVSADGRTLLFLERTPRGTFDIWQVSVDARRTPAPVIVTPCDEEDVRFSPDGRYIAFASNELGRYEIFVAPYPV